MDRTKKARAPVRAAVTRLISSVVAELEKDNPCNLELENSLELLTRIWRSWQFWMRKF